MSGLGLPDACKTWSTLMLYTGSGLHPLQRKQF